MYAAGDYRYGSPMDSGTAGMEAITAILVGPFCFLAAFANLHKLSWEHPMMLVLCTCQLYGLAWFTAQPYFSEEGFEGHFAVHDPLLFWGIVVFFNAPWAIAPVILLVRSWKAVSKGMSSLNDAKKEKKGN